MSFILNLVLFVINILYFNMDIYMYMLRLFKVIYVYMFNVLKVDIWMFKVKISK